MHHLHDKAHDCWRSAGGSSTYFAEKQVVRVHTIKAYGEVEIQFDAFTSASDGLSG